MSWASLFPSSQANLFITLAGNRRRGMLLHWFQLLHPNLTPVEKANYRHTLLKSDPALCERVKTSGSS
jgi:hypothetical protein